MRTKARFTLVMMTLSAAAALAEGKDPFSANIAGYYTVTVPANSFALIANPYHSRSMKLKNLIPHPPEGSQLSKFNGRAFVMYTYEGRDIGWMPDGDATLDPGEGAMFRNPTPSELRLPFS